MRRNLNPAPDQHLAASHLGEMTEAPPGGADSSG